MPIHENEMYCAKCRREMKPLKNGVVVVHIEEQDYYKLADLWHCVVCNIKVIKGFSNGQGMPVEDPRQTDYFVSK